MTTRAKINNIAGRILRDLVTNYPIVIPFIVRVAVKRAKTIGTIDARDTLRGLLRELYKESHGGIDPVGVHEFKHWMFEALQSQIILTGDEPVIGIDLSDAFEAFPEDIT